MPTITAISHITLTVTDLERSVHWYADTLGLRRGVDMSGPGWKRVIMVTDQGVVVGLQAHERTSADDSFDETRVGIDHLSFACADRAEVEDWSRQLDAAGIAHSDIHGDPASVLTITDPDGIAIEFFARPA